MTMTEKTLNIYQRINAVMRDVKYVQKDKKVGFGTSSYKAVTHDNVVSMLREAMIKYGIVVGVKQHDGGFIEMRDINATPNPIKMGLYSGSYSVFFRNIDDPNDFEEFKGESHASDNGDKAPGKAFSYVVKYAMLKTFSIETGENEESRADTQERVDGNLPASGAEVTAMLSNIKTIDESKIEKAFSAFSSKTNATREQIEAGELTQIQVHKINHMIQKSNNA